MFEQPPLTDREVFGRGFVMGLAAVFFGLILSVGLFLDAACWLVKF
jgi:hypothetical protein